LKDDIDCFHQAQTSRTRTPDFKADEITGAPHLEALYEHHRPNAGWPEGSAFFRRHITVAGNSVVVIERVFAAVDRRAGIKCLDSGFSVAEVVLPQTRPKKIEQLGLWE
jgi:hypothetical protein